MCTHDVLALSLHPLLVADQSVDFGQGLLVLPLNCPLSPLTQVLIGGDQVQEEMDTLSEPGRLPHSLLVGRL